MRRNVRPWFVALMLVAAAVGSGCASGPKVEKDENYIPHEAYGGCRLQGRHFHNTHVYIGDIYSPSLTEWTKY